MTDHLTSARKAKIGKRKMTQKRRKFDGWKWPGIIVSLLVVLGVVCGGAMWVQATSDGVKANKENVEYLKSEIKEQISGVSREIHKIQQKQDKLFDFLINRENR